MMLKSCNLFGQMLIGQNARHQFYSTAAKSPMHAADSGSRENNNKTCHRNTLGY